MNSASPTAPPRCAPRRRSCSRHFNDAFWDEDERLLRFMLDGEKRKVLSVASNPGHLLWSGIVPPERAARVVARLMAAGHEFGLGHPHAVGRASGVQSVLLPERLGLAARQQPDRARFQTLRLRTRGGQIARDISRAAGHFLLNQLPELYSGLQRGEARFPGAVPRRQRAAGLGSRLGVRAVAGDPRHNRRCAARPHLRRPHAADLVAGHHVVRRPARPAQLRYPLLARRQRHHALRGAAWPRA